MWCRYVAEYFAIWLFAREDIGTDSSADLIQKMIELLHLNSAEYKTIFVEKHVDIQYQSEVIKDNELFEICEHAFDVAPQIQEIIESTDDYIKRIKNMVTISEKPTWIQTSPDKQLQELIESGADAIVERPAEILEIAKSF